MTLPPEIMDTILQFALTRQYPILDALPWNCDGSNHPHACLFESQSNKRRKPHRSTGQKHRMALSAIEAAQIANDSDRSDYCFNSNVLVLNKRWHARAIKIMLEKNNFIFTNPDALRCFTIHAPHAAAGMHHVTLILGIFGGVFTRDTTGFHRNIPPAGVFPDKSFWRPDFTCPGDMVVDQLSDLTSSALLSQYFSNLRKITIHVIGWEQTKLVDQFWGRDVVPVENGVLLLYEGWIEVYLVPFQVVKGADFERWFGNLSMDGWRAAKVKVTGMEKLEDEEYVRGLERLLELREQ